MNKFELNQQNILVHIYYVNIRHVDLKTLEVLNAGNMQRHLAVRPERKEAKSKQLVQFRKFITTFEDCHLHDQAGLFNLFKTVFSPVLMGLGFT